MYFQKLIFIILLVSTTSFAYTDNDIDGVDDSIDQCLNTPFDELADKRGCSSNESYHGTLTLKLGSDISFDTFSDNTTNFNIFANYRYNNWSTSLSNSNYSTYDSLNKTSSSVGDIYLSGGYIFRKKESNTKITLGTKLATADEGVGTGENDYFTSVSYNYFINQQQDLFLYCGYTISGDSLEVDYEDYYSYSIGSGYTFNNRWYSSISYDYSGSQYPDTKAYRSISWFNSYEFTKQFFATLNYSHGLDNTSYEHTISLKFGVHFE